jgi:Family of unknown function (DUF6516)
MPKAALVFKDRRSFAGGIIELVVWAVPRPVPPSEHGFKYRLVYVVGGVRVVGYDNERGKGDHRHLRGAELAYRFVDVQTLLADFMADVERLG